MPTLESNRQTVVKVPFITKTYSGRASFINAQRCINLWPETDKDNDFSKLRFYNSPGLNYKSTIGNGPHRGAILHNNNSYFVSKDQLYKYDGTTATSVGTLSTSSGRVAIASNGTFGNQIMITDGTWGYLYNSNTNTFTKLIGTGTGITYILKPQYVTYMDGYFIIVNGDDTAGAQKTQQFYISAIYDGSTWNSLNFASKERYSDTLSALIVCKRELLLLGTQTIERWYDSGNVFPFDPIPNGLIERGLAAQFSVVEMDGMVIWLSQSSKGGFEVCLFDGTNYSTVSPPSINEQFRGYSTVNDAVGFIYREIGHTFYQLTFPTANVTWVYDITEGLWHERSDYTLGRHRAISYVFFNNQHIVGDYNNGNIYQYSLDAYTDYNSPIIKTLISQPVVYPDFFYYTHGIEYTYHRKMELAIDTGMGTLSGSGSNPVILLSYSDDGGHTYSNRVSRQVGTQGAYGTRVMWDGCLGMTAKPRTYRLDISEPIKTTISNPYVTLELGHV